MQNLLLRIVLVLSFLSFGAANSAAAQKPKVRTITAFVKLDRVNHRPQMQQTLAFLRTAKSAYEKAGYEVQTIRVTTQPFWEVTAGLTEEEALRFWRDFDTLAAKEGFSAAIGPAGFDDLVDARRVDSLIEILRATKNLNGSVIVGGEDGVYWNAVRASARVIQQLAETTPRSQGNFQFAATAFLPEGTPFYPGSFHRGEGRQFAIGLQSASVVAEAFRSERNFNAAKEKLKSLLENHSQEIERIARGIVVETRWEFLGVDLSPAPLKEDSIAAAIESLTGARIGTAGTMAAAATITEALRGVSVKRAGFSGLMLPVLEDTVLARRWSEGTLTLDSLLSYSAVCGTGLDVVPLPGDVTEQQLARIIGDVASLAVKLRKPLSVRLLPVAGKKAGQITDFDSPYLVNTSLQPVHKD